MYILNVYVILEFLLVFLQIVTFYINTRNKKIFDTYKTNRYRYSMRNTIKFNVIDYITHHNSLCNSPSGAIYLLIVARAAVLCLKWTPLLKIAEKWSRAPSFGKK